MTASTVLDTALQECRDALVKAIATQQPADADVTTFVSRFRFDFASVLGANDAKARQRWASDGAQVLAMARAIGALAEVLAIGGHQGPIALDDLMNAHRFLKPHCHAGQTRGQYCPSVNRYGTNATD